MLKALRKALQEAMERMKKKAAELEEAKKSGNEEVLALAIKAFEVAQGEQKAAAEALEAGIEAATQEKHIKSLLGAADDLDSAVPPAGADLSGNSDEEAGEHEADKIVKRMSAEAKNHERDFIVKEDLFFKFLREGHASMSGNELAAVAPKNKDVGGQVQAPLAVIPKRIVARMIPGLYQKDLPMLSTDDDAAGGRENLMYPQYGNKIEQLPTENPSFFDRVRKIPVVGGKYVTPKLKQDAANEFGGVEVTWADEEVDATDTEMELESITIQCYPVKAFTSMSRTLRKRDRYGLESEVIEKFGKALRAAYDIAAVDGTGTKQPLGIIPAASVTVVPRQESGKVSYTDLVNLKHAVLPHHRQGATFGIDDTVDEHLEGQLDTYGRPIFSATTGSGPYDRLAKIPYFVSTRTKNLGTKGDVIFGDLMNYWFCIEEEIAISRSDHYLFKSGGTAWRLDGLAGGQPGFGQALAILGDVDAS